MVDHHFITKKSSRAKTNGILVKKAFKLELCTDDISTAIQFSEKVDQIEFCANLEADGLTPELEDVFRVISHTQTKLKVMIRNRAGDFVYNEPEFTEMIETARQFMDIGISNFVFGSIKEGRLDLDQMKRFCDAVFPANVCLHKAIDASNDILEDLAAVMEIPNVNEILTSGGEKTAALGVEMVKRMIAISKDNLIIIPAGKITDQNVSYLHSLIGAEIYHGRRIV